MPGLITKSNLLSAQFMDGTAGTINANFETSIDNRTSTFYALEKDNNATGRLLFDFGGDVNATFFAIAGATIKNPDAQYRLQYRNASNTAWLNVGASGWQDINGRNFILEKFDQVTTSRLRLSFRRISDINAGFYLMHFGEFQELPRVSAPHDMLNLIAAKEIETGANQYAWLGGREKISVRKYTLEIKNYSVEEMDAVINGVKDYITAYPFFYQFDSVNYPELISLLVTDGAPGLPSYSSIIRRDWIIKTEVLL